MICMIYSPDSFIGYVERYGSFAHFYGSVIVMCVSDLM